MALWVAGTIAIGAVIGYMAGYRTGHSDGWFEAHREYGGMSVVKPFKHLGRCTRCGRMR